MTELCLLAIFIGIVIFSLDPYGLENLILKLKYGTYKQLLKAIFKFLEEEGFVYKEKTGRFERYDISIILKPRENINFDLQLQDYNGKIIGDYKDISAIKIKVIVRELDD